MTLQDCFYSFSLALGIGLLIGIQREAVYDESEGKLFAGARTFSLISLTGYVMSAVSKEIDSGLPLLGGLLVLGTLLAHAYYADAKIGKTGMTTEMAALVAYGAGSLCLLEHIPLAAALGVMTTALLSFKHEFRSFAHTITRDDIYATVKFAIVAVIVLPILPDQAYGPGLLKVLNPYRIWRMVVFIAGISFIGYILIKVVGARRGVGLTGLLGGLVSSTAVTISFSQRSNESTDLARPFALAIMLAWVVMFARVLVITYTLVPRLAQRLVLPLAVSAGVGLLYGAYLYFAKWAREPELVEFSNPFDLSPALRFSGLYAVVLLISSAAQVHFGNLGTYISSFVSGLVDLNAITLSMVDLLQQSDGLTMSVAARAIIIATLANTLFKGGFVMLTGSIQLRHHLWPGLVLMLIATMGLLWII